jgi:hypothetical protein
VPEGVVRDRIIQRALCSLCLVLGHSEARLVFAVMISRRHLTRRVFAQDFDAFVRRWSLSAILLR